MPPFFRYNEPDPVRVPKLNALSERPIQISFIGKPDASQKLWRALAPRALTIKSIEGLAGIAATASATFALAVDGVTVATIVWAAAGTVAVCTILDASIAADAILLLTAPASQDATLGDGIILVVFGEG